MANKNYVYKKEKKIFWAGLSFGVGGGIVGSLFGSLIVELLSRQKNSEVYLWILFIPITFLLIWLLNIINKSNKSLNKKWPPQNKTYQQNMK
mgnify:CR=1 FL=1